jgi:hypothetical protein
MPVGSLPVLESERDRAGEGWQRRTPSGMVPAGTARAYTRAPPRTLTRTYQTVGRRCCRFPSSTRSVHRMSLKVTSNPHPWHRAGSMKSSSPRIPKSGVNTKMKRWPLQGHRQHRRRNRRSQRETKPETAPSNRSRANPAGRMLALPARTGHGQRGRFRYRLPPM